MPEDKKDKRSNPKEQRRPRHGRQPQPEKKVEKKPEEPKFVPKVPQKPPEYESPGPEFYKNLKRETDEILKITEEENAKYKKKEIQSNWSKYEMPIESYEEIEEQENMGADYEKLIHAPLSIGGHFQFKHEKSWDLNTAPSLYDKYFEINMDNLSLALSTIAFFERNSIDKTIFTETDILSMNNRATRFKQKYYNDKSYTTPEMDASVKILNSLKESTTESNTNQLDTNTNKIEFNIDFNNVASQDIVIKNIQHEMQEKDILENSVKEKPESIPVKFEEKPVNIEIDGKKISNTITRSETTFEKNNNNKLDIKNEVINTVQSQVLKEINNSIPNKSHNTEFPIADSSLINNTEVDFDDFVFGKVERKMTNKDPVEIPVSVAVATKVPQEPPEPKKNPVIESPEDLEKWLDDFLDG